MATISSSALSAYQPSVTPTNPKGSLQSGDFLKLLITELQNQDPTKPMSNQDMLNQVSQISSLQSQTDLSTTLKDLTAKNQISTGSGLIGKQVAGYDVNGDPVTGLVTSVAVVGKNVLLELDNGKELEISQVLTVAPGNGTTIPPPTKG
jgi:flagellar basal-body rod modification protein FlgD